MTEIHTNFEKKMTRNIIESSTLAIADESLSLSNSEANSTQAATITYDFTVDVTTGSLAGQRLEGFFSYDCSTLTGIGSEEIGVEQGLFVSFELLGVTYTESDDFNSPLYPRVLFENGSLTGLDFEAFNSRVSYQIIRDFDRKNSCFSYRLEDEATLRTGSGIVTYSLREGSPMSVSEVSTVKDLSVLSLDWFLRDNTDLA
jgi:hypothetical protein